MPPRHGYNIRFQRLLKVTDRFFGASLRAFSCEVPLLTWIITNLPISLGSNKIVIMTIERTAEAIIVKLPTNINIEEIQRFLNYLRYKKVVAKSKATQDDIDKLAREVNKRWWEENKHRFLPGE
jgi:hypothetical protein